MIMYKLAQSFTIEAIALCCVYDEWYINYFLIDYERSMFCFFFQPGKLITYTLPFSFQFQE